MKLSILLLVIGFSCSYNNYSVHEKNMQVQYDRMMEHDALYKKKMIKVRKKASRSRSVNHKTKTKSRLLI